MPRAGRGRGRKGKKNGSQIDATAPPLRGDSIAAWQGYAQQSQQLQPHTQLSLLREARDTECHHMENSPDSSISSQTPVNFIATGTGAPEDLTQTSQAGRNTITTIPVSVGCQQRREGQLSTVNQSIQKHVQKDMIKKQEEIDSYKAPQYRFANMTINDTGAAGGMVVGGILKSDDKSRMANEPHLKTSNIHFFIDSVGSGKPVKTGFAPPNGRGSTSPPNSESGDDEVIVFSGRNGRKTHPSESTAVTELSRSQAMDGVILQPPNIHASAVQIVHNTVGTSMVSKSSRNGKFQARGKKYSAKRARSSKKTAEDDEILADYIANIQGNDGANDIMNIPQLRQRELGLDEGGGDFKSLVADEEAEKEVEDDEDDWDSVDLQDFAEFSTSSELMDVKPRIIGRRSRNAVLQYLVVGEDESVNEARWLPIHRLKSPSAAGVIISFERQAKLERLRDTDDESDDSFTLEAQLTMDLEEDLEDIEDEADLEDRRKARMSDEQIARLLSKQAELGIIADDLVLFNDDALGAEASGGGRVGGPGTVTVRSRSSLRSNGKSKKRSSNVLPSASLLADILEQDRYNRFDIIDQEQPSLRKRPKKGRRNETMHYISDSDLAQSMNAAWENDRIKKKQRKQEREELRAQGLLGKKGKRDLKAKFSEGMTTTDVRGEMKDFLESSAQSLPLPPMGQNERKAVHRMANKAGLKSKSVGGGLARFPVLYRTSRTETLTPRLEAEIDAMFATKKFVPRSDKARRRSTPTSLGRGGVLTAATSYRDGEVVGIGAPELGLENKGRAMLEKMGWSTGTALGATNNKGIAQPIAQIVKTSRAGLG